MSWYTRQAQIWLESLKDGISRQSHDFIQSLLENLAQGICCLPSSDTQLLSNWWEGPLKYYFSPP